MEEIITVCPRNCYSTCSFRVRIENNTIKAIYPYSGNLATPEGPCIKGLAYIERSKSSSRIIHPLLRNPDGSFRQINMDYAIGIIARRLADLKSRYGSHSLLWYRGSGNSGLVNEIGSEFWKLFGGVTITYGNLCWPAGLEAVRLTLGSVKHNVPWDIENASTILIWGKNPAETNIQEMIFIDRARKRGATIIVIDPRQTPTADKAHLHIIPKPGTDGALALAIAHVLIDGDFIDSGFIGKYVSGFEQFMRESPLLPSEAETITGVPADEIRKIAITIAENGPVTFLPGYGLQRYLNGGETIRAILSLAVITGNIGKPGAGFNYANLQSYVFDDPKEPLSYYPDKEKDWPFRRSISMAKLGEGIINASGPEIKAIWIERGNPVLQAPDTNTILQAFRKSRLTVVIDQFMTDTAKLADIIIPSKDIFEQSDIVGSYWSPYIQYKPKILEPSGEIIPESELYYHLAKRLGLKAGNDRIPAPGNGNTEKWLEKRISSVTGISLNELRKGPVIAPGLQLIAYSDMKFDTPSGMIELSSDAAAVKWGLSQVPKYNGTRTLEDSGEYPLNFMSPNTGSRIHSQFGNLEVIRKNSEKPSVEISPADAAERKIAHGDEIEVFNEQGSARGTVKITRRIPEGLVVLCNGIWIDEGGGCNMLTKGLETDMGYGASFHSNKVNIRKISSE